MTTFSFLNQDICTGNEQQSTNLQYASDVNKISRGLFTFSKSSCTSLIRLSYGVHEKLEGLMFPEYSLFRRPPVLSQNTFLGRSSYMCLCARIVMFQSLP